MTFSIIQKLQLEGANRLDPEYYQPEILEVFRRLNNLKTVEIGSFCRISDGDHSKIPGFVGMDGVRYLRAKDLQNFFINDSDPVYVNKSYFERLKRSHIKPLDIVLSIMGTVGNLAVILPNVPVVTANRAVSIISPRAQDEFNSYFLAIYLESKYGVAQRERESMGGVQERVNLDDLARIKIPVLSMSQQQIVVDIFQKALTGHLDSRLFYQQAEKLLLKEIGLADFKQRENLSFAVNLSEVTDADRVDADFFQPKYKEILEKLKGVQTDALKNYFQILRSKSFGYHDEGKVGVIKTKQVGKQFLDFEVEDYTTMNVVQKDSLPTIENLDVIFASMGVGSLGKTNIFYNFETSGNFTIDSTLRIFRTKNKNLLPEVLTVYFSSWVGALEHYFS